MTRAIIVRKDNDRWRLFRKAEDRIVKTWWNYQSKTDAINQAILVSRREGSAKVLIE